MVEVGEAVAEAGVGCVQGPSGGGVDDEVVQGDVEGFGDADQGVQGRGDAPVFVSGDLAGVGADGFGELGLGPAAFGAGQQLFAGEATRLAYLTDEAVEGRDSFLEKRSPDWSPYPWYY